MRYLLVGMVVGIVLTTVLIIVKTLREIEKGSVQLDGTHDPYDWEDLARRGDMGYYDKPGSTRE